MLEASPGARLCALLLLGTPALAQLSDVRDTLTGPAASGYGSSMAFLGDWTGDGRPEVAVGASSYPGGGMVRVLSGADGAVLWEGYPPTSAVSFGSAVADANDVDRDGFRDLLVGARGTGGQLGWAFVYSGKDILDAVGGGPPPEPIRTVVSPVTTEYFGETVLGGLNMDNDGHYDFLVAGTGPFAGPFTHAGVVRAYAGVDGSLLWERTGDQAQARLGSSLAKLRPKNVFDFDGMQDYLVGAQGNDEVWVIRGGVTGTVLQKVQAPAGYSTTHQFGRAVAVIGDSDGDGLDDFAVGAPYYLPDDVPGTTFGGVFLYLSGSPDQTILGTVGGAHVGSLLAACGDLNGDAVPDFAADSFSIDVFPTVYSGLDGTLLDTLLPPTGSGSRLAGGGDLDADGLNDVLVSDVSAAAVYVFDTGDLVVPAFLEAQDSGILGSVSLPVTYLTVRHPAWPFAGGDALVEVELDHGAGWALGYAATVPVPAGDPPQRELAVTIAHASAWVAGGTYRYRVRMTPVGGTPGAWSDPVDLFPAADRDEDGDVDVVDLGFLGQALNTSVGDPAYDPLCDWNQDGTVDILDLALWVGWRSAVNGE